jgi:hypothetical protein
VATTIGLNALDGFDVLSISFASAPEAFPPANSDLPDFVPRSWPAAT